MDVTGATWRKSSRSASNGGTCVEVAAGWRKSTRSGANGASCVEVARTNPAIAVRDSKHPDAGHLTVSCDQFRSLLAGIKADHLHHHSM